MRTTHYHRNAVLAAHPERVVAVVVDVAQTVSMLGHSPRPPVGRLARWFAFLTVPFRRNAESRWKETGVLAFAAGHPVRAAEHSTDGFFTIDVALSTCRIGDIEAPHGRFLRIEIEPGTPAHEECGRRTITPSAYLRFDGCVVVDESRRQLAVHPDRDFVVEE